MDELREWGCTGSGRIGRWPSQRPASQRQLTRKSTAIAVIRRDYPRASPAHCALRRRTYWQLACCPCSRGAAEPMAPPSLDAAVAETYEFGATPRSVTQRCQGSSARVNGMVPSRCIRARSPLIVVLGGGDGGRQGDGKALAEAKTRRARCRRPVRLVSPHVAAHRQPDALLPLLGLALTRDARQLRRWSHGGDVALSAGAALPQHMDRRSRC